MEWIELNNETYIRTNTIKYFLDEKKLVFILLSKGGTEGTKKIQFSFTIKYKNRTFNKHHDIYTLNGIIGLGFEVMVLNAPLDLNEFINDTTIDSSQLSIENVISLKTTTTNISTFSPTIKTKIGNFRNKSSTKKEVVICTEPLFLEDKDVTDLSWWIEITKLAGYKKVVIFNNSIENTQNFDKLFETHKNYVEIVQLQCLPNVIYPNKSKYLRHYLDFLWNPNGSFLVENMRYLGFDGMACNECLYANSFEAKLGIVQDHDESFLVPRLENFDTISKGIFHFIVLTMRMIISCFLLKVSIFLGFVSSFTP